MPPPSLSDAARFKSLIEDAIENDDLVVITQQGKPIAAIVPLVDEAMIEQLEDLLDRQAIVRANDEQGKEPPLSWEQVKADLSLE